MRTRAGTLLFISLLATTGLLSVSDVYASRLEELRNEINSRSSEIERLEQEIDEYGNKVQAAGVEIDSLQSAIGLLDNEREKFNRNIKITENKIHITNSTIEKLILEIEQKRQSIDLNRLATANVLRQMNEIESVSLAEVILSMTNFSQFWDQLESLQRLQINMSNSLVALKDLKSDLETDKEEIETERVNLLDLKSELADRKSLADNNRWQKSSLLSKTKNEEEQYRTMLQERLEKKKALERELLAFEAELKEVLDPAAVPPSTPGLLIWPVEKADKSHITQYFGKTKFATENPQVYKSGTHNGIDLARPKGTKILAAANGVVVDVGDTDKECWGVSYGKWVLVKHFNGLTSLYAHLSLIKARPGQQVKSGDVVGYLGNTGYSTGPHLHFTVFSSQAVGVAGKGGTPVYESRVCKTRLTMPVLTKKNGYLNPLSYL